MEKLEICNTTNTPKIDFDPESGIFKIEGRAIPENPGDFFNPIIFWLTDYFKNPAKVTVLEVNLEYVNSGSSKYLLGVFKVIKDAYKKGCDVNVKWFFEEDDEAIEGLGEHYRSAMEVPFTLNQFI